MNLHQFRGSALIVVAATLLAGCGTQLSYKGPACGSADPVAISLGDYKDRTAFDGRCSRTTTYYRPDGTVEHVVRDELVITSAESSTSQVIAAQADALSKLAGTVAGGLSPVAIQRLEAEPSVRVIAR